MSLFDNSTHEMTIEPNCPWYDAQQTYGAPNVNWCEKTQCSVINEPANTWSNLGYIVVAFYLFKKINCPVVRNFCIILAFTGFASGFYHATNNALTQLIDLAGMNLVSSYLLAFSFTRLMKPHKSFFKKTFITIALINFSSLLILEKLGTALQLIFIIQYACMFFLEIAAGLKTKALKHYAYFAISLGVLALGQFAAQIDLKRIYCNPENLVLHGHVIWHLLGAVSMFFVALHLKRFAKEIS